MLHLASGRSSARRLRQRMTQGVHLHEEAGERREEEEERKQSRKPGKMENEAEWAITEETWQHAENKERKPEEQMEKTEKGK